VQDFWEEVKFLRTLQLKGGHPHIVDFIGYVAGDSMMLVLAFAPEGSLLSYLRAEPRGRPLPEARALRFAHQIASGMAFIAANRMVHRDLAARNVLLSSSLDCNITDFGLARDVYTNAGQYQANVGYKQSNPTAYKWTSLEGLTQSVYTIESDVWSYSIVLSEICSLGDNPYVQFPNLTADFVDFLRAGGRMDKGRGWYARSLLPRLGQAARAAFAARCARTQTLAAPAESVVLMRWLCSRPVSWPPPAGRPFCGA